MFTEVLSSVFHADFHSNRLVAIVVAVTVDVISIVVVR